MVVHDCNLSTEEVEARVSKSGGHPGIHSETPISKKKIHNLLNCVTVGNPCAHLTWDSHIKTSSWRAVLNKTTDAMSLVYNNCSMSVGYS
jgi:hypothetical protein